MMRPVRPGICIAARRGALVALCLALSLPIAAAAAPRRAILVRGADPVKGLPFFAPNAIVALVGAYDLAEDGADAAGSAASSGAVAVWYSRETVVFSSAWKRADPREASAYATAAYTLERDSLPILALQSEGYVLFFELSGDPRGTAFVRAFTAKFAIFFRNAPSDAELSFPAYVDY